MDAAEESRGIHFIESWYASNCDGEWEHEFGVRMGSTDNPGWYVSIDLGETDLENVIAERARHEFPGGGWMITQSDGRTFEAACGPLSLGEVDKFFEALADKSSAASRE